MGSVVTLETKPRPSRSAQTGLLRTSYQMYLMLADIEGMEGQGGAAVMGLSVATYRALWARGLVACYTSSGTMRACVSPTGRNVLRSWRLRLA